MSVTYHTARVANPGKRRGSPGRTAAGKSPKVSPRRRSAGKSSRTSSVRKHTTRKRAKRPAVVANPLPPVIATLGAVNPSEGGKRMARSQKKSQRHGRKQVTARGRRKNGYQAKTRSHRSRSKSRSRNPFGVSGSTNTTKMVLGGLVGVTLAKIVPVMLPGSLTASPVMRVLSTGAVAYLSGMLAGKAMGANLGDAVSFGGYMQTASIALNALVPSIGQQIGLGYLTPGNVALPYNPVVTNMLPSPTSASGANGVSGFPNAF